MVVAHSNAILSQWETEIADKLGLATSALSGSGQPDTLQFETGTVEFHTAQSLLPRYDRDLADCYDLVIYDEVHHYSNVDGFGQAIRRPHYDAVMGLSATIGEEQGPKRQKLESLVAPVVYTYGVEDATKDGIIPDFEWTVHPTALDPDERTEWEETTESITNQFRYIRYDDTTRDILSNLSVPFVEMEDLGDFIQAHQAAEFELDRDIPDEWQQLQASIQSRNWIRHRSQPKLDGALELAEEYLTNVDRGVKLVMFAMDIETTERIGEALSEVTDDVYVVHSQVASSSRKKDRIVRQRIDQFANADHGVLIAPKLLDEGIDVPDAEVGINVAGTKTKLQLVQRMGRILRKHADQQPHFHHFVAVPDEYHIEGLDGKHYVQELNWVRELGEAIGEQPSIEEAHVDSSVLERAEERGHELWAQDLLADLEIETVQGTVHLDELIEDISLSAAETLHTMVDFGTDELVKEEWKTAMDEMRSNEIIAVDVLQRVWWLFPLYREEPAELEELLTAIIDKREEQTNEDTESGDSRDAVSETADEATRQSTEESVVSPVLGDDESSEEDDPTTDSVTADSEETTGESKVTTASTSSVDNESEEEPERLTPSDIRPENTSEQDETSTGQTGKSSSQKEDGDDKRDTDRTQGPREQPLAEPASAAGVKSNSGVAQETGGTSESAGNNNSGQVGRTIKNTSSAETDAVGIRNRIPDQRQSNRSPQDTEQKEDTGAGFVGRIRSILGL
jgi:superfamily II DNA or RNA helicase